MFYTEHHIIIMLKYIEKPCSTAISQSAFLKLQKQVVAKLVSMLISSG